MAEHLALAHASRAQLLMIAHFLDRFGYGAFPDTSFARFFQKPAYHFMSLPDGSHAGSDYLAGCLLSLSGDEAEIIEIAVSKAHRHQGLGAQLLADVIAFAKRQGSQRLYLEVAATNAAALALYHHHCFAESGRRIGYYQPSNYENDKIIAEMPKIDALIMELSL